MGRIADFWDRVDGLDRRIAGRSQAKAEERGATWWNLPGGFGYSLTGGDYGDGDWRTTLRNGASWACIDVLMDGVARTPLDALRGGSSKDKTPVTPQPAILVNPSGITLRDVWRGQLAWSLLTDGNTFGQIVATDRFGFPTQIELLDPTTVTDRKVVNGRKQLLVDHVKHECWPFGDIWHVPGRMVPAGTPFALSPVTYANKIIATSLAAEDFSYQFFASGGHPVATYYADTDLTPEQASMVKAADRQARSGGSRDPLVLGSGLKREESKIDPSETQFIDLMRFEVEQACRFWRVPPVMVYAAISGQNVTYANITDADLTYLKHSLDGYLVRFEEALTQILPKPQYVKANRNAILRSDAKTRYDLYQVGIRNGILNRNEIRDWEDMSPIPVTGDDYVWPPVGQGAGMDSKPPSGGGVVENSPTGADTITVAPAAPTNGKKPPAAPFPAKK